MHISRRNFLGAAAGLVLSSAGLPVSCGRGEARRVLPIRRVTHGPRFHWFGYYDKRQFDASNRYLLANEVEFEHRTPGPEDELRVGMVDLTDGDRWIPFGESKAWGWQQGCMLQWRPGSRSEVVWNDREGDRFVARILDVETGARPSDPGGRLSPAAVRAAGSAPALRRGLLAEVTTAFRRSP